ncbi:restriction endonuclease [Betaproteobacteria bacterium SCGC AG-212-J23]|nr:restriction endonuclease [Betaproteobacteria bacterium SCGC AG-212-J23]
MTHEIAPNGTLRAAINFGNTVLAQKDPKTGEARGVSVDLAHELAWRLQVPLDIVPYDAAGKVTADSTRRVWDVAFFAIDPKRGEEVAYSAPYVIIEGGYVVPAESPIKSIDEVDREGVRIAVSKGSAYDLYLSRNLKRAQLVYAPSPQTSFVLFAKEKLPVLAGVKAAVIEWAKANPGYRVLDGRFMVIEQAMAIPKDRERGAEYLRKFVEDVKANGLVASSLARSGQKEAVVAPPAK